MKQINRPLPVREPRKPLMDVPLEYGNLYPYPMTADGKLMSIREQQIFWAGYRQGVDDGR